MVYQPCALKVSNPVLYTYSMIKQKLKNSELIHQTNNLILQSVSIKIHSLQSKTILTIPFGIAVSSVMRFPCSSRGTFISCFILFILIRTFWSESDPISWLRPIHLNLSERVTLLAFPLITSPFRLTICQGTVSLPTFRWPLAFSAFLNLDNLWGYQPQATVA